MVGAQAMIETGPSWEVISTAAIILIASLTSVIVGMVASYAKGLGKRVDKLEDGHDELKSMVLKDYHTKLEVGQLLADLKSSLIAVHDRLDRAGFPHTHTPAKV